MSGTLTVNEREGGKREVEIDGIVEIYRAEDDRVFVDTEDDLIATDIVDRGVSRRTDEKGRPGYIELFEEEGQVYIRDRGSSNPTHLKDGHGDLELENGEKYPIERDCTVYIGTSEESQVQIKIEDESIPADWSIVAREVRHLETFLEEGSASRLQHTADVLHDDLRHLDRNQDTPEALDEHLEELRELMNQLEARIDTEGDSAAPKKVSRTKGRRLTKNLHGIVERQR